jgi:hypothetical protein
MARRMPSVVNTYRLVRGAEDQAVEAEPAQVVAHLEWVSALPNGPAIKTYRYLSVNPVVASSVQHKASAKTMIRGSPNLS